MGATRPHWSPGAIGLAALAVVVGGWAFSPSEVRAQTPPPPLQPPTAPAQPPPPPQAPPLNPPPPPAPSVAQLGRALFFDATLSNPSGMSCATCHAPQAGFTFPKSNVNQAFGPVPGVIPGRFGNRKPLTISYAAFLPKGPPHFDDVERAYVGGLFWDGRASDLASQVAFPLENPNEMNDLVHNLPAPELVVQKVAAGPNARLFQQVFGANIFAQPTSVVFRDVASAIAAWEATREVSPFSSKYDAFVAGRATLSAAEMAGLQLATGSLTGRPGGPRAHKNAQCVSCHRIGPTPTGGHDLWTDSSYRNTGVPKNPNNPYYKQTSASADPVGYNKLGAAYIDLGLGDFLHPTITAGTPNVAARLAINGVFKVPTLRNVDKRPTSGFVKCYGHNGVFKSLKQVVHFYNTRNLTTVPGEVINFASPNPYAGLKGKPLWPAPETPSPATLQNFAGGHGGIGNLGLTDAEENQIVAFLQTLSDAPTPAPPP